MTFIKHAKQFYYYLKGPEPVANIQTFFGVKALKANNGKSDEKQYIVTNKFWYYLFLFATALGDETFYAAFIPFWFWNVDGAVGRRFIMVWAVTMYIGQSVKDILCWPRPGSPVIQLQSKWSLEYGMPSTHALIGVTIPFSVVLYTMDRYDYNVNVGFAVAVVWCTLICISRLYLGMHTVLDIIAGVLLALLLMVLLVPLVDQMDYHILTNPFSPLLLVAASVLMIVYYPISVKWTPTRGDTAMVLSVCVGVQIGSWLNYQTGQMVQTDLSQPYTIFWPSWNMVALTILRTIMGFPFVFLTRSIISRLAYIFLCAIIRENVEEIKKSENTNQNKHKTFVDLGRYYISCFALGFNSLYVLPHIFRYMQIERPTFYTEI